MNFSEIPVLALWLAAAVCTAVFAVTWGSWMTGKLRRAVYYMIAGMALFGVATYYGKEMPLGEVLFLYSVAMLALALGVLGRRGELTRLAEAVKRDPKSPDNKLSTGATVQIVVAGLVVVGAGTWFMST
ncbi:hypothetical protein [Streptomyces sp. DH12]|uniref:hypothetical protein n=1 Tax=Streptomyces sp. DH12 TaxID=2857010 RepID=UPI001E4CC057|nr:hypothetical protein [Streptomyces sp. DH12]